MAQLNHKHEQLERVLQAIEAAESRLASIDNELAHTERLATLGTLSSAVVHEFNNILTPVLSYAQLALASPDDRELTKRALERAASGAERAARIASALLGFARSDSEAETCDAAAIAEDAAEMVGGTFSAHGVKLSINIPEDATVACKPISLQQVLLNLLLNADQAIQPEPGAIQLSGQRSTWNGADAWKLSIEDNGCGMTPETIERVFQPFASGPNRTGRLGSGLGLAICQHLVQEASGSIKVESTPGEGTRFDVFLPAA